MRRVCGLSLALLVSIFSLVAASAGPGRIIAIATGGTGGVYYPLGCGMAEVLAKYIPGVTATARVTGGSVDNLKLIGQQQSQIALVMADVASNAVRGDGKFKNNEIAARTLMVLYPNRMHIVTLEGRGIGTLADLEGRRVSIGSFGSATEVMASRMIEIAGLDRKRTMRRERFGVAESARALRDGTIDAFFWVGGLPTAAVTDLAAIPGVKLKLIDHGDMVAKLNARYGGVYSAGVIPSGTYPGQAQDSKIAIVQSLLVAPASMADRDTYTIVKSLIEHRDELIAAHPEARSIDLANQAEKNSSIPWHPGARKYFADKGVKM